MAVEVAHAGEVEPTVRTEVHLSLSATAKRPVLGTRALGVTPAHLGPRSGRALSWAGGEPGGPPGEGLREVQPARPPRGLNRIPTLIAYAVCERTVTP